MIYGMTEREFIKHPDTVDFIVRKNPYFDRYAQEHPEIYVAQTLMGKYMLVYAHRDNVPNLLTELGSTFVNAASLVLGVTDRVELESAGIVEVHNQPYLNLRGSGVILGFVDTGIDYTKEIFVYPNGKSKILYLYDQSADGTPPEGFTVGQEYTNAQINEALQAEDPYTIVPQRDTAGHGTFLASVAAGREVDGFVGAAPEAELVVVKLRRAREFYLERAFVPPEQENAFESSKVMLGVEYILQKARQLGRPVVICIGLGTNFGTHDGTTPFEDYLSSVANLRGVCLVTAAGNESQAQHHAHGRLNFKGEAQNIDIKIGSIGNIGVRMSIINSAADRFSVSIRSPTGELIERVPVQSNMPRSFQLLLEASIVEVEYYFPMEETGAQLTIIRIHKPTPGIWTLTVHGDLVLDGTYDAWLPMTGFSSPRAQFLSPDPYGTVVVPATMHGSIVCGAYDSRTNSLNTNSSWGPNRLREMAPDLLAPGVRVGGFYPRGYGSMSGTSVAAAIAAGAAALLMEWGVVNRKDPSMSTYQIRAYLVRGCSRSEDMVYPNYKWGYGTLNLLQTFNYMRET